METSATFSISTTGKTTGQPFAGEFTVKTVMTRRDEFYADQERRRIVGPSPENTPAPVGLQGEAYMLGQLRARITAAPDWWKNSDAGLDLQDVNVIVEIFELALAKEKEI